jgi:hypothetical protein
MWLRRGSAAARRCARAVPIVALLVCLGAGPAAALAGTGHVDGISDQSLAVWDGSFAASPFADRFRAAWSGGGGRQIRLARYVVQWNAMAQDGASAESNRSYRERFEAWLQAAGSLGLIPVLALTSYDGVYPGSPGEYGPRLQALLLRAEALGYPIRFLEPWNEPNGQGRQDAVSAAVFANTANGVCAGTGGCEVIAGDFEDRSGVGPYQQAYQRALRFRPRIWGVHPYVSVESHSEGNLLQLIAGLPSAAGARQIWFTEVGARYCSRGQVRGEAHQASDASYLVDALLADPAVAPAHAFYYGFLFGYRSQAPCSASGGEDTELFTSSDTPRAAARVILMPAAVAASPQATASPGWPAWTGPASLMIERLPDGAAAP